MQETGLIASRLWLQWQGRRREGKGVNSVSDGGKPVGRTAHYHLLYWGLALAFTRTFQQLGMVCKASNGFSGSVRACIGMERGAHSRRGRGGGYMQSAGWYQDMCKCLELKAGIRVGLSLAGCSLAGCLVWQLSWLAAWVVGLL